MMTKKKLQIGVLALQGDFERHMHQLLLAGAQAREVRLVADLDRLDGLIIPGGESTSMNYLIDRFDMRQGLLDYCRTWPVWGTCAGLILLAKKIEDNLSGVQPFGLMDIDVVRNGYGRQVFSFTDQVQADLNGSPTALDAVFIRAPRITRVGSGITVLAAYRDAPVLVVQDRLLASSFHSELDDDIRLLDFFLKHFVTPQEA